MLGEFEDMLFDHDEVDIEDEQVDKNEGEIEAAQEFLAISDT